MSTCISIALFLSSCVLVYELSFSSAVSSVFSLELSPFLAKCPAAWHSLFFSSSPFSSLVSSPLFSYLSSVTLRLAPHVSLSSVAFLLLVFLCATEIYTLTRFCAVVSWLRNVPFYRPPPDARYLPFLCKACIYYPCAEIYSALLKEEEEAKHREGRTCSGQRTESDTEDQGREHVGIHEGDAGSRELPQRERRQKADADTFLLCEAPVKQLSFSSASLSPGFSARSTQASSHSSLFSLGSESPSLATPAVGRQDSFLQQRSLSSEGVKRGFAAIEEKGSCDGNGTGEPHGLVSSLTRLDLQRHSTSPPSTGEWRDFLLGRGTGRAEWDDAGLLEEDSCSTDSATSPSVCEARKASAGENGTSAADGTDTKTIFHNHPPAVLHSMLFYAFFGSVPQQKLSVKLLAAWLQANTHQSHAVCREAVLRVRETGSLSFLTDDDDDDDLEEEDLAICQEAGGAEEGEQGKIHETVVENSIGGCPDSSPEEAELNREWCGTRRVQGLPQSASCSLLDSSLLPLCSAGCPEAPSCSGPFSESVMPSASPRVPSFCLRDEDFVYSYFLTHPQAQKGEPAEVSPLEEGKTCRTLRRGGALTSLPPGSPAHAPSSPVSGEQTCTSSSCPTLLSGQQEPSPGRRAVESFSLSPPERCSSSENSASTASFPVALPSARQSVQARTGEARAKKGLRRVRSQAEKADGDLGERVQRWLFRPCGEDLSRARKKALAAYKKGCLICTDCAKSIDDESLGSRCSLEKSRRLREGIHVLPPEVFYEDQCQREGGKSRDNEGEGEEVIAWLYGAAPLRPHYRPFLLQMLVDFFRLLFVFFITRLGVSVHHSRCCCRVCSSTEEGCWRRRAIFTRIVPTDRGTPWHVSQREEADEKPRAERAGRRGRWRRWMALGMWKGDDGHEKAERETREEAVLEGGLRFLRFFVYLPPGVSVAPEANDRTRASGRPEERRQDSEAADTKRDAAKCMPGHGDAKERAWRGPHFSTSGGTASFSTFNGVSHESRYPASSLSCPSLLKRTDTQTDGGESSPASFHVPSQKCIKPPIVLLHGFGFGLLPYMLHGILLLLRQRFFTPEEERRPVVLVEFGWLGLDGQGAEIIRQSRRIEAVRDRMRQQLSGGQGKRKETEAVRGETVGESARAVSANRPRERARDGCGEPADSSSAHQQGVRDGSWVSAEFDGLCGEFGADRRKTDADESKKEDPAWSAEEASEEAALPAPLLWTDIVPTMPAIRRAIADFLKDVHRAQARELALATCGPAENLEGGDKGNKTRNGTECTPEIEQSAEDDGDTAGRTAEETGEWEHLVSGGVGEEDTLGRRPKQSSRSPSYRLEQKEADETYLEDNGVKVDVLAHSYGTAIASCLNMRHPSLFRCCVLVDPVCFIPNCTMKAQLVHRQPWEVVLLNRHSAEDGEDAVEGEKEEGCAETGPRETEEPSGGPAAQQEDAKDVRMEGREVHRLPKNSQEPESLSYFGARERLRSLLGFFCMRIEGMIGRCFQSTGQGSFLRDSAEPRTSGESGSPAPVGSPAMLQTQQRPHCGSLQLSVEDEGKARRANTTLEKNSRPVNVEGADVPPLTPSPSGSLDRQPFLQEAAHLAVPPSRRLPEEANENRTATHEIRNTLSGMKRIDYRLFSRWLKKITLHTVDRYALLVYWLTVYREVGTRLTTSRQLQGHEYLDRGGLLHLRERLMIVLGGYDLISPSTELRTFFQLVAPRVKCLFYAGAHHGVVAFIPSVLRSIDSFLFSPEAH